MSKVAIKPSDMDISEATKADISFATLVDRFCIEQVEFRERLGQTTSETVDGLSLIEDSQTKYPSNPP
jgi:hypothetical protein